MSGFLTAAGVVLSAMAVLGLYDIVCYHLPARLASRSDSRSEAIVHAVRGVVYALQFSLLPNVRFAGLWYAAFVALFVVDVFVAIVDVALEPKTRKSLGGLPGGEYLSHIVLSILAGAYLTCVAAGTHGWLTEPTQLSWSANMPLPLRLFLGTAAIGCVAVTVCETLSIVDAKLGSPKPIHVRVVLSCSLRELWEYTQDHRRHPDWDHRFSAIVMLGERVRTGTEMRYEKRIVGVTIRGFGRYVLHRPMKQSTFEFWSDDRRSLIRRGTGLWRYVPLGDGRIEFRTSYTYEVRWGAVGRIVDRFVFRPLLRWETHRSFVRLARERFADRSPRVVSSLAAKPPPLPARAAGMTGRAASAAA